jgi:hypothetical protein
MEEYYLKDGEYGAQFDWPTDTIPSMFEDGPLNQKDLEQLHKGDKDEEDRPPNQKEQLHKADKNKDADMDKPGWGKPEKDSFLVVLLVKVTIRRWPHSDRITKRMWTYLDT